MYGHASLLTPCQQNTPGPRDLLVDAKQPSLEARAQLLLYPSGKGCAALTFLQPLDSIPQFAECYYAEIQIVFIRNAQPVNN